MFGMATLSLDLRERILSAYDKGDGHRDQIARRFCVSEGMVKKLIQQRRHLGDIRPQHHRSGRKPKILATHRQAIRKNLAAKPDLTLEELRDAVGLECTIQALHYALVDMGLTYKKTLRASEQDRDDIVKARRQWRRRQNRFDPNRLVFLDESGAQTNMTRLRGRAGRGKRVNAAAPCGRWASTTMIGSIRLDGTTTCMTIAGATDTEVFRAYVGEITLSGVAKGGHRDHGQPRGSQKCGDFGSDRRRRSRGVVPAGLFAGVQSN